MDTYLSIIGERFDAAGAAIAARLAAVGLPPLVDWLRGEPAQVRETNFPYAWWDYDQADEVGADYDELNWGGFQVPVVVVLALGAATPPELVTAVEQYPPQVVAAIEGLEWPYEAVSGGVVPGPRATRRGAVRLVILPWLIRGQRAYRGVS